MRILKAIANNERIILYGDADLDGASSVILLEEAIKDIGGKVEAVYFPDRETEGYGINEFALNYLKNRAPALFISLDCGIGNFEEVELANEMGFEVLIVDHHKILGRLPAASIVVDPRQPDDKYPFKELAAAGVVYRLVKSMLIEAGKWDEPEKYLELVALATLADMMILEDDNVEIVKSGLLALANTKRVGLKALIELTNCVGEINIEEAKLKIIPPLNSGGTVVLSRSIGSGPKEHLNEIYLLLTETDLSKAKEMVEMLIEKNNKRKEEIRRIFYEIDERVKMDEDFSIIFEGDVSWPLVLLGPSASRICKKYNKPVFLFKKCEDESPGAVRTPRGIDSVKAMDSCKELLKTYGGHPPASGFRIKNENLEKFKQGLIKYFSNLE